MHPDDSLRWCSKAFASSNRATISKVHMARSTRPFVWLEFALRISMFSSFSARPNCVASCANTVSASRTCSSV